MKKTNLKIWLTKAPTSPFWLIRYKDLQSGRTLQKSTGETKKKNAERKLGEFRADLLNRRYVPDAEISWAAFRSKHEAEVIPSLAKKTGLKIDTIFNAVERILNPAKLTELSAERMSYFQATLRDEGRAENTIAGYLAHLRAALNWACEIGLLREVPTIKRPKRAKASRVMKGRPITENEFQAMLDATAGIVDAKAAESWKHYLRGLWWSGLRLAESLELHWDDNSKLCVVFDGDEVMLRIPAELEKGNTDRLLPVAPEFADFLSQTHKDAQVGRVFKLKPRKVRGDRLTADRVTRIVSDIGRAAKVLVDQRNNKFATAHDLRRSFGERWAERVMPQVLMELMRHESIETTLRYYVGKNAQRTARILREAYDKTKGTNGHPDLQEKRDTPRDINPEGPVDGKTKST